MGWVSWKRMCNPKARGGLGFRNLKAFNLAMLAKKAWRILNNPSSLVARVLKAKYFPTDNLLNAKLGSSPFYSWRSIHSSFEVIRWGTRWRVGNGKQIHIWKDRWLPTPSTYKVISPQIQNFEFPMVLSLIDPVSRWWKTEVLHATFLPFEVETILKISLSYNLPEDKLIWIGNRKGEFLVKSSYHVAHSTIDASEEGESFSGDPYRQLWRNLWHLNLPVKIKIFSWRACVNGLPTYDNISKRGINCSTACSICGLEPEDINHALLHYEVTSIAWSLWPDYPRGHHWSFLDMALHLNCSNAS